MTNRPTYYPMTSLSLRPRLKSSAFALDFFISFGFFISCRDVTRSAFSHLRFVFIDLIQLIMSSSDNRAKRASKASM